ncbi:LysR family transcriptional regulator [Sneathiella chungangensis]|uniref:LysR family transcriptional regulator n=1 Tax=Sneathiella chungangensis TaxID=1418234 RepID=A0A845MM99_9PROT|nr:LysR family transcriptional regulator [Sneathiella chungangensis]MZR24077.1 LysR family transcriptional regulator [Sneathiella chungangensis]
MDIASQMILFANVVDHGSFSATARSLGLTPSAVSKQISQLEDRLGVRLLNRSTRHISMTAEGQSFYERCAEISAGVTRAEELAQTLSGKPQGNLRIAATVAFGKARLLPLMSAFIEAYPEIKVALELTDRHIDLSDSEFDLAIRFPEQITDASLVACKLASSKRILCASPAYIKAHGAPLGPNDLKNHNCLRISTVSHWNDWHFRRGDETWTFTATGNFDANSADAVYHATLSGLGIAQLSSYLVEPDLAAGRLVALLPDYEEEASDIFAVYSDKRNLSPKVRVFIDYLVEHFRPLPH